MPAALAAGMDCQTFWQSNPKRIKQFLAARKQQEAIDLQGWTTAYYVLRGFNGKFPKKPDLLNKPDTDETVSTETATARWIKWAQIQQARLIEEKLKEAKQNERLEQTD